jgi:hypothetical protein
MKTNNEFVNMRAELNAVHDLINDFETSFDGALTSDQFTGLLVFIDEELENYTDEVLTTELFKNIRALQHLSYDEGNNKIYFDFASGPHECVYTDGKWDLVEVDVDAD